MPVKRTAKKIPLLPLKYSPYITVTSGFGKKCKVTFLGLNEEGIIVPLSKDDPRLDKYASDISKNP